MDKKKKLLREIFENPYNVKFREFCNILEWFGFKEIRKKGSHHIYACPDIKECMNIQEKGGEAKPYQIKQFFKIVEKYNLEMEA